MVTAAGAMETMTGVVALGAGLRRALSAALIVAAAWVAITLLRLVVSRLGRGAQARAQDEEKRRRAGTSFVVVEGLVTGVIVFAAGYAALLQLGVSVEKTGRVAGAVIVAWVGYRVASGLVQAGAARAAARIENEGHRQRVVTLMMLGDSVARYVIVFFAAITVLGQVGVDLRPVLAGAGIVGLAVGFGAQNLVRDVISGFFLILEGQYAVGDLVEVNGVFGRVELLGLRTTRLRDPMGQLRYFANGAIMTANNYTENHIAYVATIPVPAEGPSDVVGFVRRALADFGAEFRVFCEPPEPEPPRELPTYARVVRVPLRVIPGRQAAVEQRLAGRLAAAFARAGHPLPAGTEVTVVLRYPPPGADG